MRQGFFGDTPVAKLPVISNKPLCRLCRRDKHCNSPMLDVVGKGKLGILFISEQPGEQEDNAGVLMKGPISRELREQLDRLGVNFDEDCWLINSVACYSKRGVTPEEIDHCRPLVKSTIDRLKPKVIVTMGDSALRAILPMVYGDDMDLFTSWIGWNIPSRTLNAWVIPTFNTAYVVHKRKDRRPSCVEMFFRKHLHDATTKEDRPYKTNVKYDLSDEITIMTDAQDITRAIDRIVEFGGRTAFDYEATCLKPERPTSKLLSCSICWEGKRTLAFPWRGDIMPAMKRYLLSPRCTKIASNMKFENRWTIRTFGTSVVAWEWDTMLNAKYADFRDGICGLKFQSCVVLGYPNYAKHIKPYMAARNSKDKGGYAINRLTDLDLRPLLIYNGIDSLLEYHVALKQMELLEWDPGLTFPDGG